MADHQQNSTGRPGLPALAILDADMKRLGVKVDGDTQRAVARRALPLCVAPGETIQNQARVAQEWVFVSDGIAASEQSWSDGATTIARFFEAGSFCANFTSLWTRDIAADDLRAVTQVTGLAFPDAFFRHEYLHGGSFGTYLRLKVMEAHVFAKELVCAKTSGRTEVRYQFLQQYHRNVIGTVPQKDIARFLGITPQGLSRFLRREKAASA
ncbi:MAG: hypothetical protein AAFU86_03225 [Pseudomonadota bacterium]